MRFPWVSRLLVDLLESDLAHERQQYADLLAKYHALKTAGAVVAKVAPQPVKLPQADPEQRVIDAHSRVFVENAVQAFVAQGKSERDARQMAEALRDQVVQYDGAPSFAGV